jgi:hypothetical protein
MTNISSEHSQNAANTYENPISEKASRGMEDVVIGLHQPGPLQSRRIDALDLYPPSKRQGRGHFEHLDLARKENFAGVLLHQHSEQDAKRREEVSRGMEDVVIGLHQHSEQDVKRREEEPCRHQMIDRAWEQVQRHAPSLEYYIDAYYGKVKIPEKTEFDDGDVKQFEEWRDRETVKFWAALPRGEEVLALPNMVDLSIHEQADQFDDWIENSVIRTASKLNLSGKKLKYIPESIGKLVDLKHLDLSRNNLLALPESLGKLKKLESLNISRNKFKILPESVCKLLNLKKLNMRLNSSLKIPNDLRNLDILTKITVDDRLCPSGAKEFIKEHGPFPNLVLLNKTKLKKKEEEDKPIACCCPII